MCEEQGAALVDGERRQPQFGLGRHRGLPAARSHPMAGTGSMDAAEGHRQGRRSLAVAARRLENRGMGAAAAVPSLVELVAGANLLPTELVRVLESAATVCEVVAGVVLLRQRAVVDDLVVLVRG